MDNELLARFVTIEGVFGVVLIGADGTIIESAVSGTGNKDALGAIVPFVMAESAAVAETLGHHELSLVVVEFEECFLISMPMDHDRYIVVLAMPRSNIAKIQFEMRHQRLDRGAAG